MFTLVVFIVVLSILVFAHELGHFWTAKKFGIEPEEFGIGMPPRALAIYKNSEDKWVKAKRGEEIKDAKSTIYALNWLPLGGYVKLGEDDDAQGDPNHFNSKPAWQRGVILLAGVTMNVILAGILLSIGFMIGLPMSMDGVDTNKVNVTDQRVIVVSIENDSPAEKAGLEIQDIILGVNNYKMEKAIDLQEYVDSHVGEELAYKIERGGEELEKKITPELRENTGKGGIGIGINEIGTVKYPIYLAIWYGFKATFIWLWMIISAFYMIIKNLILGNGVGVELGGPVKIASMTGDAARMGISYLINFTAMLSLNLAVINALPIPALDGGRIIFLIIEKIKGSPVKKEVEGVIHYIGFALLMLLVIIVTYNDIVSFFK